MNLINSQYAKAIIGAIGMILVVLNSLAGASAGFTPQVQGYITLAIAILTPVLTYLQPNANSPVLKPGQVVVQSSQMVAGTVPAASHKP